MDFIFNFYFKGIQFGCMGDLDPMKFYVIFVCKDT